MTDLNEQSSVSRRKILAGGLDMAAAVILSANAVPKTADANPLGAHSTDDHRKGTPQ
jgi:hypothetical protein